MWYLITFNDEPGVMYKTNEKCVMFALTESPLYWRDKYEEWVADGNEPKEWTNDSI